MISFDNYLFVLMLNIVPIFIYFYYFNKQNLGKNLIFMSSYCSIVMILSMSFPLELAPGHIYDLRIIPLIITFLYGGWKVGIVTTIVLCTYRMIIGLNVGLMITLLICFVTILFISLTMKRFTYESIKKKMTIICSIIVIANSIDIVATSFFTNKFTISFILYFYLAHLVTGIIACYLIESLKEQEKNREKEQQSDKLKLIGEMAASVAHEIRNPLTVVKGYTQLLMEDVHTTSNQVEKIKIMASEISRAEVIINDYLSLASIKTKSNEVVDIRDCVKRAEILMMPYAMLNNVQLSNKVKNSFNVEAEQGEVLQVLINIMKNGMEAIDKQGEIIITAEKRKDFCHIKVHDNGRGMSKEEVEKLGSPFYSTKSQGTGIGTTVCFHIVHRLNGEIEIDSKPNEGTTFTISLPLKI